jgi:hypothetical protein
MSERHTGEYLAWELEALLKSFGIEKQVGHFLFLLFLPETSLPVSPTRS